MPEKTTGQKLIYIGGMLLLLGGISSNPAIPFIGGIGGWVMMVAGLVVMLCGVGIKAKQKRSRN